MTHLRSSLLVTLCAASTALAQSRARAPEPYALQGVQVSLDDDTPRTLILRDGRIDSILDVDADLPPGCKHLDGEGLIALPAFVDAYTHTGCETPDPVIDLDRPADVIANAPIDMRQANRKGIQPGFASVDVLAFGETGPESHREAGFGLLLSAPAAQILSGKSALATTRDGAVRDAVVRAEVFQHAAFRASGSGYPSTKMGYHAQLRQLFYDADRHTLLESRIADGRGGTRPSFDRDLDAGAEVLARRMRLVCEAETVRDIRRWIRLADEFGLQIAISGGREAWKCADELARRDIPVFLTLNWGDEVDDPDEGEDEKEADDAKGEADDPDEGPDGEGEDGDPADGDVAGAESDQEADEEGEQADDDTDEWLYEEPLGVRRERRRLWEEGRDCALRLDEAEVRFAFGSGGEKPKALMKNIRTLVKEGLGRDVALAALTTVPAALLEVGAAFGEISPGHNATLALWTRSPFKKKAKVAWLFVDGFAHDLEVEDEEDASSEGPAEDLDLTGTWGLQDDSDESSDSVLELEMDADGTLTGTIEFELGGNDMSEDVEGTVSGNEVRMHVSLSVGGMDIKSTLEGTYADGVVAGEMTIVTPGGEQSSKFTMTRTPENGEKGGV